jgi:23S rRNA U2552 (ribose-2'-O)-methylase RlmE/FtsJ
MYEFIKFEIKPVSDYIINYNDLDSIYQNKEFDILSTKLNNIKDLLNNISINDYNYISRKLDMYKAMKILLIQRYNMQLVTNATIKIYEILSQINIINGDSINVFCNAELPGGFIIGINQYVKTVLKNGRFNWIASSYLGDENDTLGDYYGIYKCNSSRWLMDKDMNGDLTNIDNILEISIRVLNRFPMGIDLYTSDAGFDVSDNYNEQEEKTLLLNYGQILTGLLTLSKHGNFIVKQFTYFTIFSRSLLTLLSTLFNKFYITKPMSSRPINSEIYIIGIDYKGLSSQLKEYLINKIKNINKDIPLILYEPNNDLLESARCIYNRQIRYIKQAYNIYDQKQLNKIFNYKRDHEDWLIHNPMYKINKLDYVCYDKL